MPIALRYAPTVLIAFAFISGGNAVFADSTTANSITTASLPTASVNIQINGNASSLSEHKPAPSSSGSSELLATGAQASPLSQPLQNANSERENYPNDARQIAESKPSTKDFDEAPHAADVLRRIKRAWKPPQEESSSMSVIVKLEVQRDGTVSHVQVVQSSDVPTLDQSVTKAIEDASPFRRLPEGAPDSITFKVIAGKVYPSSVPNLKLERIK